MPLKITEDVLKELGFVQQNPPYIWDYPLNGQFNYGEKMFRVVKSNYGGADQWSFHYGKGHPVLVNDVMAMMQIVGIVAYHKGVQETQDKLHDALGFHRLVEQIMDRYHRED